ncbi:MAG: MFS transporter [Thermodesulfobacteriota bacterium]
MKKKAIPLYLFSFSMIMPMIAVVPLLPMIRDELTASYSQISIFVACLGIVRILFAFPSGFLADRFDRKKILLLSGFLSVSGLFPIYFGFRLFLCPEQTDQELKKRPIYARSARFSNE